METAQSDVYSQKPWLKFYDDGVPSTTSYPRVSYPEFIREAFEKFPDRAALLYMGRTMRLKELDRLSNKFAHYLLERGCKNGDVIGVHLPNIPASYIAVLGIQKAGCVFTGVSALLTPEELEYQLNDAGVTVLVTLDIFFENVKKIINKTGVRAVVVAKIADYLPVYKKYLGAITGKIPHARTGTIPGIDVSGFAKSIAGRPGDPVQVRVDPDNPCVMMYTGGTTGKPKGAVLTHNNIVHHIIQNNYWLDLDKGRHVTLCPYPLFHIGGSFIAMGCIASASTLIAIPNPRDLDFLIHCIKKYRPTSFLAVPTLYLALMKRETFRALDFSCVEYFISGSGPFPTEYITEFEELVGNRLIEGYGLTEATTIIASTPFHGMKKTGSVGMPLTDTDVKIVDPDTGEIVPVGREGELIARGPQVFTIGYHNQPEETARCVIDGWLHTGDVAKMDEDGFFYIVDRIKDMVCVSGFKVFTRVVDDVLIQHPDIDNAATVGIGDPERKGSEIVASAIVLKSGREKCEDMKRTIIEYMRERVSPYKVPKVIVFMDSLPLSPLGKVLKRELRRMLGEEKQ